MLRGRVCFTPWVHVQYSDADCQLAEARGSA